MKTKKILFAVFALVCVMAVSVSLASCSSSDDEGTVYYMMGFDSASYSGSDTSGMKEETALIENTSARGLPTEHGLSLFVETAEHKFLFDMGQTDLFARNAETLGIDLSKVDFAVLSHGHYDHGGGLPAFLAVNPTAAVYLQASAAGDHYSLDSDAPGTGSPDTAVPSNDGHRPPRCIGLPDEIRDSADIVQIRWLEGGCRIDRTLAAWGKGQHVKV